MSKLITVNQGYKAILQPQMRGTRTIEKYSTKMHVGILLTKPLGVFPSAKLAHTI